MTAIIIAGRYRDKSPTDFDHLHAILYGERKIEDMLERPAIKNNIIFIFILLADRDIHVVHNRALFVIRIIKRIDLSGPKGPQKILRSEEHTSELQSHVNL